MKRRVEFIDLRMRENHRGQPCSLRNIICQEAFCDECGIYLSLRELINTGNPTCSEARSSLWQIMTRRERAMLLGIIALALSVFYCLLQGAAQ